MNKNNFIPYREKENNDSEPKFVPNKITALRRKKSLPQNQLEPELSEIPKYISRDL